MIGRILGHYRVVEQVGSGGTVPKNQHEACAVLKVNVKAGEEFEWITTNADSCDIHIIDDHPWIRTATTL